MRVARGPLPHRPENPTMDNRPGQGSTRPVGVRQEMVLAPMPGRLVQVKVKAGQIVAQGDTLLVLEAMKMEHALLAPADGKVAALHFAEGDQVEEGVELLTFADPEAPSPS